MVRIWCVPVEALDRQHLLGEHHELHTIFSVLHNHLKGFSKHTQTLRFKPHISQLVDRHYQQIQEMLKRGYNHHIHPLDLIMFSLKPEPYVYTKAEMKEDLKTLESRQK